MNDAVVSCSPGVGLSSPLGERRAAPKPVLSLSKDRPAIPSGDRPAYPPGEGLS